MVADAPLVRPFARGDEEGFLRAKCAGFGGLVLANERTRWRREFDGNPAAPAPFPQGFVLEQSGTIRGGIALLPCRVAIGDEVVVGACGIDLCVDASLRGRGLGRELLRRWLEPTLAPFAFAASLEPNALALCTELGAELLAGAGGPVAWVRFTDAAHPAPTTRERLEVAEIGDLPPDTDALWAAARRGERLLVVRDAAYLRWRWRDLPFGGVTMLRAAAAGPGATRGLAFLQDDPARRCLYLADLLHERGDEPALRTLVRRSIEVARARGRQSLWFLTRDARADGLLRDEGFEPFAGPRPTYIAKLNRREPRSSAWPRTGAWRASDWSPSIGDCDVIFNCAEPAAG